MTKGQAIERLKSKLGNDKEYLEQCNPFSDIVNEVRLDDKSIEIVLSMLEEKDKGINSLMQSRKKWKNRYYKMKNKNKDLQKSVEQIYDDYQDIGKMAFDYSDKIEQQDKIIDLMAEQLTTPIHGKEWIKQYFENKAKEVE